MRYSILALFAALLVFAPAAGAAPVKVKPVFTVSAATKSGKNVKFTIAVTVAEVPKCKGKVTATYKISKKTSVSWWARYTGDSHICTASIKGKLPKKFYGKKTKFAIKFPGNDSIKKFSASKSLTLSPPPPPPPATPAPAGPVIPGSHGPQSIGQWHADRSDDPDTTLSFRIGTDYRVIALIKADALKMTCSGMLTDVPFNWSDSFGMGIQAGSTTSGDSGADTQNMVYTLSWNFSDAHTGTGHFSAVGNFRQTQDGPFEPCSTSFDLVLSGGF